jgi:hypothetical protein
MTIINHQTGKPKAMTYEECARKLRHEDGYNHVDSNRWGKVAHRATLFAWIVPSEDNGGYSIKYANAADERA